MTALTLVLLAAAATLVTRCVQSIIPEPIIAETASIEKELIETAKRVSRFLERQRFWTLASQLETDFAVQDEAPPAAR